MATTPPLHNYLRMYRKRAGLTQREVAALLGCAHGSKVSRYERGERLPSLEVLVAYEVIFGVSLRELFEGVHHRIAQDVHTRIRALLKQLDEEPYTPQVKQKFNALVDVVYPGAINDNTHLA